MKKAKNNLKNWIKVKDLKKGMKIATPTDEVLDDFGFAKSKNVNQEKEKDILWDEIVEIKKVGEEKVYDIEVEGTHNFVAGHLIDKETGEKLSEEEEQQLLKDTRYKKQDTKKLQILNPKSKIKSKLSRVFFGGIYAHNTYLDGNATTTGYLEVGTPTGETEAGDVNISGVYRTNGIGADYAEYFYTDDADLEPGEVVSIDITNPNAVKRTDRMADSNIIGIVSTNPAFVANPHATDLKDKGSVIVGLLGQVPAKVSDENGEIRPGDSLTSSSQPGILMKASAGDSTVGVALEGLEQDDGTIQVLISRRNKSLTVEQVEEKITQRVADMEIEDEVNLLISGAMDNLGVEEKINEVNVSVVDLASQAGQLDIQVNDLEQQVENLKSANEFDEMMNVRALATSTASTTESDWLSLPEAGDVLVIDPENDLSGVKNYEKNSNQILGVVSGQTENALAPLTITGTAQVKISLENGEIKKGDLLTTSSIPGYAMKTIDENAGIIGIALEDYLETDSLDNNKISVLLTIRNNVQINEDDVNVAVEESEQSSQVKIAVEDYDFQGNVAVKDLQISGKVIVMGEAEFLSEATFKNNLNLQGAIVKEYQTEDENLNIGDAVRISGSGIVSKAYSDDLEFKPAIGLVVEISEQEQAEHIHIVKVAVGGTVGGFRNLVPGDVYYLNNLNNNINNNSTSTATTTPDLIEIISLTNVPTQEIGNYIQTIGIAESENSLLILPSLVYEEYTENLDLPSVNYNPIYIDNVTITENTETEKQENTEIIESESSDEDEPDDEEIEVVEEEEINDEENQENIENEEDEEEIIESELENEEIQSETENEPEIVVEEAPAEAEIEEPVPSTRDESEPVVEVVEEETN